MTPVSPKVLAIRRMGWLRVTVDDSTVIAERFLAARRDASGLEGYPGEFPATLDKAYEIQERAIASWGQKVVGWKVGRIMPPYSGRFGTDRLAGPIFSARETASDEAVPMPVFERGFAAGEAEFLLRIGATPSAGKTSFTLEETADLIDSVHVGIEIASSPLPTINALGPVAVVSDFGNNNGLLVGPRIDDWRGSGFEDWPVTLLIDGAEAGRGTAAAFPDGALGSARFLFELMARRGIRLEPGQWISSGAVGGVHEAGVGQTVEAGFGDKYRVRCQLTPAQPQ